MLRLIDPLAPDHQCQRMLLKGIITLLTIWGCCTNAKENQTEHHTAVKSMNCDFFRDTILQANAVESGEDIDIMPVERANGIKMTFVLYDNTLHRRFLLKPDAGVTLAEPYIALKTQS